MGTLPCHDCSRSCCSLDGPRTLVTLAALQLPIPVVSSHCRPLVSFAWRLAACARACGRVSLSGSLSFVAHRRFLHHRHCCSPLQHRQPPPLPPLLPPPTVHLSIFSRPVPTVLTTPACSSPIRLAVVLPSSLSLPPPSSRWPDLAAPPPPPPTTTGTRSDHEYERAHPTLWPSHSVSRLHPATPCVPSLDPSWGGATRTIESVDFDWPCPAQPWGSRHFDPPAKCERLLDDGLGTGSPQSAGLHRAVAPLRLSLGLSSHCPPPHPWLLAPRPAPLPELTTRDARLELFGPDRIACQRPDPRPNRPPNNTAPSWRT